MHLLYVQKFCTSRVECFLERIAFHAHTLRFLTLGITLRRQPLQFCVERRIRMKSSQWERIVSSNLSATYLKSASDRWNRLRNLDFANRANAAP